MQMLKPGPGYVFRFPTRCIAVIMLATNLLSNILTAAYELMVHDIIFKKVADWCVRLFMFRSSLNMYFLPYSWIDLILAYLLFTSTTMGNNVRRCLCRAKWIRNSEFCLLVFNIWWGHKSHPYSDTVMFDAAMYVGLFQLGLTIIIVWLYVQELERAVKNGGTILEMTPPQLPEHV